MNQALQLDLINKLVNKDLELEQANVTVAAFRDYFGMRSHIDTSSADMARQCKDAFDSQATLAIQVEELINQLVDAYDPNIIWTAKTLGKMIFLRRISGHTRHGSTPGVYGLEYDDELQDIGGFKLVFKS